MADPVRVYPRLFGDPMSVFMKCKPYKEWPEKSTIPKNYSANAQQAGEMVLQSENDSLPPNERVCQKLGQLIVSTVWEIWLFYFG